MSLALYSEDGFATELGSATAMDKFMQNVEQYKDNTPALNELMTLGYTDTIDKVVDDLSTVLNVIKDKGVKSVGESLKDGLVKIKNKEIAIISQ